MLEPKDLLEKLEFNKVLELIVRECYGELGKEAVRAMPVETELPVIERKLREVAEYKLALEKNDQVPLSEYHDIYPDLRMLEVVDYVLSEESFKRIGAILLLMRDLNQFFTPGRQPVYPHLYDIMRSVAFDEGLIEAIERVIDDKGEIRSDASPELLKIRKATQAKQRELERVFRSLINEYRNKGWLTDNVESFRNGRRVLSVPAEHKRKIRGIIHDESTSGKTAFIEPEPVIEINNDIFDLYNEEKREIHRILKELSAQLRPYVPVIRGQVELLVHFDQVQAKARLALRMKAGLPKLVDRPHLGIQMGYHPLLLLKNNQLDRVTVPFDLTLHGKNRILVLSGPNAGGKSITMKSVGLLQLMLQSGMLVPVDEISEMGVFQSFFADIGDQQSLEDDLSTYSSRLENMRNFLATADERSLMLIDEFGSGTDPKIGGAIAEAILKELNDQKVFGVITTHYSNLKIFAFNTPGIVNGSMLFDKDQLAPTYQLKVGRPGSSYAFEIAHKSGLPRRVLNYAKRRTGKNEKAVDQLLVDLQREKQELEEKLAAVTDREKQLEKLIRNYEQLHRDLEYRRKKFKLDSKEQALQQTAHENRELERLIRQIREEKNLEKAREMAEKVREERQELNEVVSELREEIYYQPVNGKEEKEIEEGDYVKMRTGAGSIGQVEAVDKNKAIVLMGQMRVTVPLRDLQHARAPLEVQKTKSIHTEISQTSKFENKIDIRGMRMEEALKVMEEFVDRALMANVNHLQVVHGKGNGVLRKAVRMKLEEYDAVLHINHPEEEQGGNGVTLVELR